MRRWRRSSRSTMRSPPALPQTQPGRRVRPSRRIGRRVECLGRLRRTRHRDRSDGGVRRLAAARHARAPEADPEALWPARTPSPPTHRTSSLGEGPKEGSRGAAQQPTGGRDGARIVLGRNGPNAGSRTSSALVAGARPFRQNVARADRAFVADGVEDPVAETPTDVGAVQVRDVHVLLVEREVRPAFPVRDDPWERLVRHGDVVVAIVVASEAAVVARIVMANQVALENQRLPFVADEDDFDISDLRDHLGFPMLRCRDAEVGGKPVAEAVGLPDVDDRPVLSLHEIAAGMGGEGIRAKRVGRLRASCDAHHVRHDAENVRMHERDRKVALSCPLLIAGGPSTRVAGRRGKREGINP